MLVANILLVLPLGALALPVTEGEVSANGGGHKDLLNRAGEVKTAHGQVTDSMEKRAGPASDNTPVTEFAKRSDEASESLRFAATLGKRQEDADIQAELLKRAGGPMKRNNTLSHSVYEQPELPEFIDTGACICGLLLDQSTGDKNGEVIEKWRCTASLDYDISKGGNGKWYNTTFPSQERSGINMPRDWDGNQPDVRETFVLTFQDGGASYQLLSPANSGALFGADVNCTGVKDGEASILWYATQP